MPTSWCYLKVFLELLKLAHHFPSGAVAVGLRSIVFTKGSNQGRLAYRMIKTRPPRINLVIYHQPRGQLGGMF
ncbi:MAG: hypothetical protein VBE63_26115 [Lamprobacter sp.]|uniref:hypothetical protein n=1 Tax=Lamprobacter sp. TaxID=3100796 RepID=UPI002B261E77|nr:hypothetical protein [Lamprobacter sp.]MEA3643380.1 hypothetical protein [Lamprobacter sp.]